MVRNNAVTRTCPGGHELQVVKQREMYNDAENGSMPYQAIMCDECDEMLRRFTFGQCILDDCAFVHCGICDYDLCMKCFDQQPQELPWGVDSGPE